MTRVNLAATLEPDADGDGFGDESQDIALTVKLKNKLRPKRSGFPVRVSCGATECDGTITGKAVAKQRGGSSAAAAKKRNKTVTASNSLGASDTLKARAKLKP